MLSRFFRYFTYERVLKQQQKWTIATTVAISRYIYVFSFVAFVMSGKKVETTF